MLRTAPSSRAWRRFIGPGAYRKELVAEAACTGHPVLHHPFLHYPDDATVRTLQYQFLLGSELLVAPVLDEGAVRVRLYLPAGDWTQLWTDVAAPLGQPVVFAKRDSTVGARFRATPQTAGIL